MKMEEKIQMLFTITSKRKMLLNDKHIYKKEYIMFKKLIRF